MIKIVNVDPKSPLRMWEAQILDVGTTDASLFTASAYQYRFVLPYKCRLKSMYWTNGATVYSGSNGVAIQVKNLAKSANLVAGAMHSQGNAAHGGGVDWTANGSIEIHGVATGITAFDSDGWNAAGTMINVQVSGTLALNGIGAVAIFEIHRGA